MIKPVLYLDVNGVLWDVLPGAPKIAMGDPRAYAKGADGLDDFLALAFEHFEVRWCTMWAMPGQMSIAARDRLAEYTGVSATTWAQVRNSCGWERFKYENINAEEHRAGRPFVWVGDASSDREHQWLRENGWEGRYFHTDVFEDPKALIRTTERLQSWLNPCPNCGFAAPGAGGYGTHMCVDKQDDT